MKYTIGILSLLLASSVSAETSQKEFIEKFIQKYLPKIKMTKPEGTYLAWLDFSEYNFSSQDDLENFIYKKTKVGMSSGIIFGGEGKNFMRFNFATPRKIIKEVLERIYIAT